MKFRGEFQIENLHHFVGCLMCFRKLTAEVKGKKGTEASMNGVIRITQNAFSVVAQTTFLTDGVLEIRMDDLFRTPFTFESAEDGVIALDVSINGLYETLSAAVSSNNATLKLKRDNDQTTLSVTFPDPAYPSISITLDIAIKLSDSYDTRFSLVPKALHCTSYVGFTRFQGILCFLESANKIGNELAEFELYPLQEDPNAVPVVLKQEESEDPELTKSKRPIKAEEKIDPWLQQEFYIAHAVDEPFGDVVLHSQACLKLRSPGLLADLETVISGVKYLILKSAIDAGIDAEFRPKTVLRTEAVYAICKNAVESIVFNKNQSMLLLAVPDDYAKSEWSYFIFSVSALRSCQMVFTVPNHPPYSQ